MKKIIFTTIACLFLSLVGYAQNSSLDQFFNQYAESEGFTYIFYSKGQCGWIPKDLKRELSSVKFTKLLSCRELDMVQINQFKEILSQDKYELIRKTKTDGTNSETYQKISENKDIEQVTFYSTPKTTQIRWISGKLK
jgi:hypothetical protein